MTHLIHCEIDRADGALQRLIGLVERRGFDIASLALSGASGEGAGATSRSRIALDVSPREDDRCVAMLGRQIDRLYGVRRVEAAFAPEPA